VKGNLDCALVELGGERAGAGGRGHGARRRRAVQRVAQRWPLLQPWWLHKFIHHFTFYLGIHLQLQGGLTSDRRPIVKIIAESLSQHEKHVVPTPLSGIRIEKRRFRNQSYIQFTGLFPPILPTHRVSCVARINSGIPPIDNEQ
jgi:hypothetical protein